jgi:hypothetical protein
VGGFEREHFHSISERAKSGCFMKKKKAEGCTRGSEKKGPGSKGKLQASL